MGIGLDERTVIVLRAWRKTQLEENILTGRRAPSDEFVFTKIDGESVHPDYFSQLFNREVAKTDLPKIRQHNLRHTRATILLKAGIPVKVVSELLGHSSPAFTTSVYQHVLPGVQADAARAFGDAVFGR